MEGKRLMVWWIVTRMQSDPRSGGPGAPRTHRLGPFATSDEAEAERRRLAREQRQSPRELQVVCDFS